MYEWCMFLLLYSTPHNAGFELTRAGDTRRSTPTSGQRRSAAPADSSAEPRPGGSARQGASPGSGAGPAKAAHRCTVALTAVPAWTRLRRLRHGDRVLPPQGAASAFAKRLPWRQRRTSSHRASRPRTHSPPPPSRPSSRPPLPVQLRYMRPPQPAVAAWHPVAWHPCNPTALIRLAGGSHVAPLPLRLGRVLDEAPPPQWPPLQ